MRSLKHEFHESVVHIGRPECHLRLLDSHSSVFMPRNLLSEHSRQRVRHCTQFLEGRQSSNGVAKAWFEPLPAKAVELALARGDVLHSCGAFTIDDPDLGPFVSMVEGDGDEAEISSSISGLPRARTLALLQRAADWLR